MSKLNKTKLDDATGENGEEAAAPAEGEEKEENAQSEEGEIQVF